MNEDASWLSTGWMDQASNGPNNLRYFRHPTRSRPLVSATRNRLLNCNTVSLTARETATKLKEIKDKYRILNLERQRTAEQQYVPYVTKVQINLKPLDNRNISAKKSPGDNKVKITNSLDCEELTRSVNSQSCEEKMRLEPLNLPGAYESASLSSERADVVQPLSAECMTRQDVNQLIDRLYGQLTTTRPTLSTRRSSRPLASFTRPTKGEIDLMERGLRPISNQQMKSNKHYEKEACVVAPRSNSFSSVETSRKNDRVKLEVKDVEKQERIKGVQGRPISKSAPHRLHASVLESNKCLCCDCKTGLKYEQKINLLYGNTRSQSTELTRGNIDSSPWLSKNFEDRKIRIKLDLERLKYSENDLPPAAPPSPVQE